MILVEINCKKRLGIAIFILFVSLFLSCRSSYGLFDKYGLTAVGKYKNGKKHGSWKFWDVGGNLISTGKFKEGRAIGIWTDYLEEPISKGRYYTARDYTLAYDSTILEIKKGPFPDRKPIEVPDSILDELFMAFDLGEFGTFSSDTTEDVIHFPEKGLMVRDGLWRIYGMDGKLKWLKYYDLGTVDSVKKVVD